MYTSILSTRVLTIAQQELVLNTGAGLTHFDVLKTIATPFNTLQNHDHFIITSQNAVLALLEHIDEKSQVYCVGNTTASILKEKNIEIKKVAQNALELANFLISNYTDQQFTYLCSEQRRDELPALFKKEKIPLKEIFVYRSIAIEKSFDRIFAAVTFYSPRGVDAFAKANHNNKPQIAVCIGETTAKTARNYYDKVVVANKQTIENTLITAIKALRND